MTPEAKQKIMTSLQAAVAEKREENNLLDQLAAVRARMRAAELQTLEGIGEVFDTLPDLPSIDGADFPDPPGPLMPFGFGLLDSEGGHCD